MANAFTVSANTAPYQVRNSPAAGRIANAINGTDAPMAAQSQAQNLTVEDAIDEDTFNRASWASIKGPASVMPVPRHTVFEDSSPHTPAAEADDDH